VGGSNDHASNWRPSSALSPLIVGWLKDSTQSFGSGLIYASIMLATGCAGMLIVPVVAAERRATAVPKALPKEAYGPRRNP
jgi:MFS-type transporter involved in bile tolerance (Atg22 family)